jgi:hypothetical protein
MERKGKKGACCIPPTGADRAEGELYVLCACVCACEGAQEIICVT